MKLVFELALLHGRTVQSVHNRIREVKIPKHYVIVRGKRTVALDEAGQAKLAELYSKRKSVEYKQKPHKKKKFTPLVREILGCDWGR